MKVLRETLIEVAGANQSSHSGTLSERLGTGRLGPGFGLLRDQFRRDDSDLLPCEDVHLGPDVERVRSPHARGSLTLGLIRGAQ